MGANATARAISTVVVADLIEVGAGDAGESRARWREAAADIVRQHDGAIIATEGGRVVADFRGGDGHEHDAERAVEASFEMRRAAAVAAGAQATSRSGEPTGIRIGIDTGRSGDGARTAGPSAADDAVTLATYLATLCPTGSILASAATYRHIRGRYQMRALPAIAVDVRRHPVAIQEVVSRRRHGVRLPVTGVRGIETELSSRREEMHQIWSHFGSVVHARRPSLVLLTGEPGTGKSRLVRELMPYVDARGDSVSVLAAPGGRDGGAAPYPFVDDLLCRAAGVRPGAAPESVRGALEAEVRAVFSGRRAGDQLLVVSSSDELERVLAVLLQATGRAPADPPQEGRVEHPAARFHRVVDATRLWLRAAAARGPLLLIAEDLHRASELSLEILGELLDTPDLPLLVVATCRNGPARARIEALAGHRFTLELHALDADASRAMVEAALRRVHLLDQELSEAIAARSQGSPLFVEELIAYLIDAGALIEDPALGWLLAVRSLDAVAMPDTLAHALQARVNSLSPAARELLARAAILGMCFAGDALAAICAGADGVAPILAEVLARGFLLSDERPHLDATGSFRFAHELVRDVAHELGSLHERQGWHLAIGDWLLARAGANQASSPNDLAWTAHHLVEGADHDRAAVCAARAGDAVRALWARGDAVRLYRAALEEVDASRHQLQSLRIGVPERLGDALVEARRFGEAIEAYDRLLIELGDPVERARVVIKRGRALEGAGNRDAAAGAFRKALADAQAAAAGPSRQTIVARALHHLGRNRHVAGDYYAAGDCYRKGLDTCVDGAGESLEAAALHAGMAALAGERGHLVLAIRHLERAVEIEHRLGDDAAEAACRVDLASALARSARHAEAAECLHEAIALQERLGDRAGMNAARAQLLELDRRQVAAGA